MLCCHSHLLSVGRKHRLTWIIELLVIERCDFAPGCRIPELDQMYEWIRFSFGEVADQNFAIRRDPHPIAESMRRSERQAAENLARRSFNEQRTVRFMFVVAGVRKQGLSIGCEGNGSPSF